MTIRNRLERLERMAGTNGRKLYVVHQYEGETDDQAKEAAGIEPTEHDMVVLIRRFSGRPAERFVSCQDLAA